jgi:phosphoribosylglycinamide formyltransferase 1
MLNIAVLGSTRGTSIDKVFNEIVTGYLDVCVKVIISNKKEALILERAKNYGFEYVCVESKGKVRSDFDKELLEKMQKYSIDLVVLVGYMKILDAKFVRVYENKIINVHPSLLPKFAGGMDSDVHDQVIKAGEFESGCTVHMVDQGVDTGKILLQKSCLLDDGETPETLKVKIQQLESEALLEVIRDWQKGA